MKRSDLEKSLKTYDDFQKGLIMFHLKTIEGSWFEKNPGWRKTETKPTDPKN